MEMETETLAAGAIVATPRMGTKIGFIKARIGNDIVKSCIFKGLPKKSFITFFSKEHENLYDLENEILNREKRKRRDNKRRKKTILLNEKKIRSMANARKVAKEKKLAKQLKKDREEKEARTRAYIPMPKSAKEIVGNTIYHNKEYLDVLSLEKGRGQLQVAVVRSPITLIEKKIPLKEALVGYCLLIRGCKEA